MNVKFINEEIVPASASLFSNIKLTPKGFKIPFTRVEGATINANKIGDFNPKIITDIPHKKVIVRLDTIILLLEILFVKYKHTIGPRTENNELNAK